MIRLKLPKCFRISDRKAKLTMLAAFLIFVAVTASLQQQAAASLASPRGVDVSRSSDNTTYVFDNGFVELELSLSGGAWLSSLRSDFNGLSNFGGNLFSEDGFRLEREDVDGTVHTAVGAGETAIILIDEDEITGCKTVNVPVVVDDAEDPFVSESWTLTLCPQRRSFTFTSTGACTSPDAQVKAIRHTMALKLASSTGFYENGVVQMMNAQPERSFFASANPLSRLYFLGEGGAVDISRTLPEAHPAGGEDADDHITVMMSSAADVHQYSFRSGYQEVLVGSYSADMQDLWTAGWIKDISSSTVLGQASWQRTLEITPNNFNFPAGPFADATITNMDNDPAGDLGAFVTGIYANAVGCLCTFDNEVEVGKRVAQIATTLRTDNCKMESFI